MKTLVNFMNSIAGRAARIALGLALVYVGLVSVGGTTGYVVAVIGLLPIALGLWGRCVLELVLRLAPQH